MDSLTQLPLFPLEKTCSHCNRALPYDSFRPDGKRKDGYFSWCRQCERDWKRTHRPAPHPEISERRCHDCGLLKPLTDFYRQRNCVAGRSYRCKACSSARSHRWHVQHREQEIKRMRRWYRDNEQAVRAYSAAHLSEQAARARAYYQRHKENPQEAPAFKPVRNAVPQACAATSSACS